MTLSLHVAVIGGGPAGIVAARQLQREGHAVTVFEQGACLGGVWVYDEAVEDDDMLGAHTDRPRVHTSMYRTLRTNLPREIMGLSDFPFTPEVMGPLRSKDKRRYCGHAEVLSYLQAVADYYDLNDLVRLNTAVTKVEALPGSAVGAPPRWRVHTQDMEVQAGKSAPQASTMPKEQAFDAVVVCNGHFSEPRLPSVRGAEAYPGLLMHAHNYRHPERFKGQVVLVVGGSYSGEDISREVATVATHVYLSSRSWTSEALEDTVAVPFRDRDNITRQLLVEELTADGFAIFPDGQRVGPVHSVIYCTGYVYTFPFLVEGGLQQQPAQHQQQQEGGQQQASAVTVADNRVGPLYLQIFPPDLAPTLSFVGLPWKAVPMPCQEVQCKLIARVLAGKVQLPSPSEMHRDVIDCYSKLEADCVPVRYTHMLHWGQFPYNDKLASMCGPEEAHTSEWRQKMYHETGRIRRIDAAAYRDGPFLAHDEASLAAASQELNHLAAELLRMKPGWHQQPVGGRAGSCMSNSFFQGNY